MSQASSAADFERAAGPTEDLEGNRGSSAATETETAGPQPHRPGEAAQPGESDAQVENAASPPSQVTMRTTNEVLQDGEPALDQPESGMSQAEQHRRDTPNEESHAKEEEGGLPEESRVEGEDASPPFQAVVGNAANFVDWINSEGQNDMVHDLVTCVLTIIKVVPEKDRGLARGELILALFRAYQTANALKRDGYYKNLTLDQIGSLVMYTYEFLGQDIYRMMNKVIADVCVVGISENDQSWAWRPFVRLFTSACKQAEKPFTTGQLHRGQPLHAFNASEPGAVWQPLRFMSTALLKEAALKFPAGTSTAELLTIELQTTGSIVHGVDLSPLSNFEGEHEVLLFPNQRLQQTSITGGIGRHKREVHVRPAEVDRDTIEEIPVQGGINTRQIHISVYARPTVKRTDSGTNRIMFKAPSGLTRTEIVTYHGPAGGGLEDDKEYVVRVIAEDRAEDTVELRSLDDLETPVILPSPWPANAYFSYTAGYPINSEEHTKMWMRAGRAWLAFKHGGKELCHNIQWGGIRIVVTMLPQTFCLWYAQVDIIICAVLVIILAVFGHSGITYIFPFIDILLQVIYSYRAYRINARTSIRSASTLILARMPFHFLRFAIGCLMLAFYFVHDKDDSHVPAVAIFFIKVCTPLSMGITCAYVKWSGNVQDVEAGTAASTYGDHFINASRQAILQFRYAGSLFVYYDSCLHGYIAQITHIAGCVLIFFAFWVGVAQDMCKCFHCLWSHCAKDGDGEGELPCPPASIIYPGVALSGLVWVVGQWAHWNMLHRLNEWNEAGGEQGCLINLGTWQHHRFEHFASQRYWKMVRAEARKKLREAAKGASARGDGVPSEEKAAGHKEGAVGREEEASRPGGQAAEFEAPKLDGDDAEAESVHI